MALLAQLDLDLLDAARTLAEAGAGILQLRHKGHWSRQMFDQASALAELCRSAGVAFIVNDRADIALLLDAGLHVGQDDLPPADARRIVGDGRTIGFSTHNAEQLANAAEEPVDYLALGPIFPTTSKLNPDPVVGLAQIRALRVLTERPLVAIGGIRLENAGEVWQAGADSIAVISDLFRDPNLAAVGRRFKAWARP